jgi:uncharacterized protein
MLIKIHSIGESGKITSRSFDNRTCTFFDEEGEQIDVSIDIPEEERERIRKDGAWNLNCCTTDGPGPSKGAYDEYRRRVQFSDTTLTKSRAITSLRVQMGMACNYSCQYCKQSTHGKYDPHATLADAEDFVGRFGEICTTDRNEPINIQLWGGEPLLYWSVLTLLGEFFRKEFPFSRITVLSNGSLMTREKADWFLEKNIILAFSHDGPGQLDYRSGDCLEDGSESLDALRYYASKSSEPLYVNAVITKGRYDLVGIIEHIEGLVGKNTRVGFEGIVLVEDEAQFDASTMFAECDYLELRQAMVSQLVEGKLNGVGVFRSKINALLSSMTADGFKIPGDCQQKCSMDSPYNVSFDLKGNILACHSTPKTIGHIDAYEKASLEQINFVHWSKRPECLSCPVLVLCRGGCLAQDATAFWHSCNNEFHFNMVFFEVVFELFFGEKILAFDGVYRPTKQEFITRNTDQGMIWPLTAIMPV